MKQIFLFIVGMILTVSAHAANKKLSPLTPVSPDSAVMTYTGKKGKISPLKVNGKQNEEFIKMMLADPNSQLSKIRSEIEKEYCDGEVSTPQESYIQLCGEYFRTKPTVIGGGHSGATEAGSDYAFFIGFQMQGSGMIANSEYVIVFSEYVNHELDEKMDLTGIATKTLKIEKIVKLN